MIIEPLALLVALSAEPARHRPRRKYYRVVRRSEVPRIPPVVYYGTKVTTSVDTFDARWSGVHELQLLKHLRDRQR